MAREHLDRWPGDDADLVDGRSAFRAFQAAALALQGWHDQGCSGPRPTGRLRPLTRLPLSAAALCWAAPLHRAVYDPDGRLRRLRLRHQF